MGLFGSLLSATIKVAVTPLAVVADVASALEGEEIDNTTSVLSSAVKDVAEGITEIPKGNLL